MTTMPESRLIDTNSIKLAVYEAGPEDGLPVILCHGFPELAYSWRQQIPALAAAGCRVICPDQRGYGRSDKPSAVRDYSIQHLTGDLIGLLDHYGIERAVFVGHDWGGLVVWQVPLLHPDRVAGIAGLGVPFIPRAAEDPIATFRRMWGDRMYIVNFQDSQEADAVFDGDPYRVFDALLRKNPMSLDDFAKLPHEERIPDLVKRVQAGAAGGERIASEEELRFYADTFAEGGFTGPINWYRNWSQNWRSTSELEQRIRVPALFIEAGRDLATAAIPDVAKLMEGHVDDLEVQRIPDSGHWIQQEYPEEVNRFLVDWLQRRFLNSR